MTAREEAVLTSSAFTLVLLCGGRGRRLGAQVKPNLVRPDGRTLLEALEDGLSPLVAGTVVVVPVELAGDFEKAGRTLIFDDRTGPRTALEAAARAVETPWLWVVAADHPVVRPALLAHLSRRVTADVDVVAFEVEGRLLPTFALYARTFVLDRIGQGGAALLALLDAGRTVVVSADTVDPSDRLGLVDVDTPEDVERWALGRPTAPKSSGG